MNEIKIIGIDPAPKKDATVVLDGGTRTRAVPVGELKRWIENEAEAGPTLIMWDAPLSLDDSGGFYRRGVDDIARKWVASLTDKRLTAKAVGIAAAASCPHNLLSQHVFGRPAGIPDPRYQFIDSMEFRKSPGQRCWIAEVHPAVAIAAWWSQRSASDLMPVYKQNKNEFSNLVEKILTDSGRTFANDDHLDAWVAWRLGQLLVAGEAFLWRQAPAPIFGDEEKAEKSGLAYYVMPRFPLKLFD